VIRVRQAFEDCARQPGNRVPVEYRACYADGAWLATGRPSPSTVWTIRRSGAIVVSYRDINARKLAESALVESERVFALTFAEAPIGIAHMSLKGRC